MLRRQKHVLSQNTTPFACTLKQSSPPQTHPLVAQSSATGVTVVAIPPCSAIRFRNPKVPRYPPPARRTPCLLHREESAKGGARGKVRHLELGGVARFWRDISDSAGIGCDTLCATLCSAIGVSTRMCH